ncbi:MAG: nicotinamide-nucleotide adenylyltransferase [DPANN group archaeon]|nr:nicotinamide-nucleotide adenylyltransferase [DPANN group archaeon]
MESTSPSPGSSAADTPRRTALFIGRFQPFHLGHLEIVREALASHDHLFLIIGSAQAKDEDINPYALEERKAMIQTVLEHEGISPKVTIIGVEDIHNDQEWVRHVLKHTPKISTVFAGQNRLTKRLFSEAGFPVVVSPLFRNITATEVRRRMLQGMRWHHLVPEDIVTFLEKRASGKGPAAEKSARRA